MRYSPTLHEFVRAEVLSVLASLGYTVPLPRRDPEPVFDAIRLFLQEQAPGDVTAANLYRAWQTWAQRNGLAPISMTLFGLRAGKCHDLVRRRIVPGGRIYTVLQRRDESADPCPEQAPSDGPAPSRGEP